MNDIKLTFFGDPILREKLPEIKKVTDRIRYELNEMLKIMKKNEGCGIAANQCNIRKKMFIAVLEDKGLEYFINPEILEFSEEKETDFEGCLSDPERIDKKGVYGLVERSLKVKISYLDYNGKAKIRNLEDFNARVVQHELDHVNGIIYRDKLVDNKIYSSKEIKRKKINI